MANRSYLYSFNVDEKGKPVKFFDISEQNYQLPIIYKILVSSNTQRVPSQIFENRHAIAGNAVEGRKRLNTFFKKLQKENLFDNEELSQLEEIFQDHLDKYSLDSFLFEPAEVIEMSDVDAEEEVLKLGEECADFKRLLKTFFTDAKNNTIEWSELGIDCSTHSYFTLGNEKEVKKIEKQFSNKKLGTAKKMLAKKPTVKRYLKIIYELDREKDSLEIDAAIDKAVLLNPTLDQYMTLVFSYSNLDKRIALYEKIEQTFQEVDNSGFLSSAHADKKEYDLALKYFVKHLIKENNPNTDIWALPDIIEKGNFNALEVYQNISKEVKIKLVEQNIIRLYIEAEQYQKALDYYDNQKAFLADTNLTNWRDAKHIDIHIIWCFLYKNQIDIALRNVKKISIDS